MVAACLAALAAVLIYLVPWGSTPVGWDVWWNLLVAQTWAADGFPSAMPQAGFTVLAEQYGDRQLAFHGLLALIGGADLGPSMVPPVVWGLVMLNGIALLLSLRLLGLRATPLWLLLLPALSASWLFRATALRDMLLGSVFLLPLVATLAARASGRSVRPAWLVLLAAGFTYSHGAVVLPLVLAALSALGTLLDQRRWSLDMLYVLLGTALACVLRPDFPHNLGLLATLNFDMPMANLRGEIGMVPVEFLPLAFKELLRRETPLLLAMSFCAVTLIRRRSDRYLSLALPIAFLALAALLSQRFLELAAPLVLMLLVCLRRGSLPKSWLLLALVVLPWQISSADRDAQGNRNPALSEVGAYLKQRARPGDMVFVTDWALSSPLAWYTRGSGLRFTGVIDPILMFDHDPEIWRDWLAIKTGADEDPIATVRERFGARFLVFSASDGAGDYLKLAVGAAMQTGLQPEMFLTPFPELPKDARNWVVFDLQP